MRKAVAVLCTMILPWAAASAQTPYPPSSAPPSLPPSQEPAAAPSLSPEQLDNLVAPIALYPDPLLGQVLAASTYPLEIVEAQQWLQQNSGLRGQQLIDAARQQNWDPSVAALVAFPDAMAQLTRDIRWTTDLGNAFLGQQADVMAAIQQMRARAQQSGTLQSTSQQIVTSQPVSGGPPAIQIQPADPQVIYVPQYNPVYVWGPPVWGAYPPLWYPSVNLGVIFGPAIFLGSLFAGFLAWGGWGWALNWLVHGLFLNGLFFHHFGFAGFGGGFSGVTAWAHNPVHRLGVAYPNRMLASRFASGGGRMAGGGFRSAERSFNGGRSFSAQRSFNAERNFNTARSYSSSSGALSGSGSASGGWHSLSGDRAYSARSSASPESARNFTAPQTARNFAPSQSARNFSSSAAPRSSESRSYSAPQSEARASSQHFSAPRSSGGGEHFRSHGSSSRGSSSHSSHSSGHSHGGGSHKH
ncbi:MAG TPA: DUF3300 domain-containing protein [Bryobacteraceae bacterium]